MPSIQNAESPLQCSRCGSQWFAEHEYRQYANQSYQSAIRGPIVAMSDPQVARVALVVCLFARSAPCMAAYWHRRPELPGILN